jgi:hypothetical protein
VLTSDIADIGSAVVANTIWAMLYVSSVVETGKVSDRYSKLL